MSITRRLHYLLQRIKQLAALHVTALRQICMESTIMCYEACHTDNINVLNDLINKCVLLEFQCKLHISDTCSVSGLWCFAGEDCLTTAISVCLSTTDCALYATTSWPSSTGYWQVFSKAYWRNRACKYSSCLCSLFYCMISPKVFF